MNTVTFLVRSASYFVLTRNARQLPLPKPRERSFGTVSKKPLCSNQQGKTGEPEIFYKTSAPASTCLIRPTFFLLPIAAEGRFQEVTSPIQFIISNPNSRCQSLINRFNFSISVESAEIGVPPAGPPPVSL